MSQLEEINVFIRVVEAGGISKAAEQLGIAKSAVSRRLAEFEKRMGVTLINRTTRTFNLSEAGLRCYEHANRVVDVVEELNCAVAHEEADIAGPIRLSIPNSFALNHMGKVIDQFLTTYPNIQLDIDLSDRFIDLVAAGIDVAIRIGELKDSTLKARRLSPINTCLVASPAYLNEHGRPQTLDDLAHHDFLLYGSLDSPSLSFINKQGQSQTAQVNPKARVNNGDFLHQLAVGGHGIALTPTFISWQAIKQGELEVVLPDYQIPERSAYALYPNTRFIPRKVRLFIDFMTEQFGNQPYWDEI